MEVGGCFLSAFLEVLFDKMTSREVLDFFRAKKPNRDLLNKLKTTMISVNGVLDDAEEKQITKPAVKLWLDDLKDALYDAEDLFDEIDYEIMRFKLEGTSQKHQVGRFFTSLESLKNGLESFKKVLKTKGDDVLDRVGMVLERLEYLVRQKAVLGLKTGMGENLYLSKFPTSSLVDEYGVFGRDNDKEVIMELLKPGPNDGGSFDVIPIVGMGGVGKTTLAQLVYNDGMIQEWFNVKAWVCVTEEFDVSKVTKHIFEEITRKKCDTVSLNLLQVELREKLMGKRFLLVLDDVWNDKYTDWDMLRRPLKAGAHGSKIIVTTRNENVASIMRTVPSNYCLKVLNDDDCWSLFATHAFDDGNSGVHPNLEAIGREIVKKCKGLPLASKTLGGLLRSKRDVVEWEKISKSNLWDLSADNILPALRLSYHYLPSPLKRCFAYCAIFLKDYLFGKEELVLLWMAEGLLGQPRGNKEIEEIGAEYFHELVSRSFFQISSVYQSYFVMHDLVNDLAKFVSGEFCFRLEVDDSVKISERTRHLSYARLNDNASKKFNGIYEAKLLRSFLSMDWFRRVDDEINLDLLWKLERLRVLSLCYYDNIVSLPDSIGNFKHLRYLDLSNTSIRTLPETVCSLYNLQTLILYGCQNLVKLPTDTSRLINLCYLDIGETILQGMPPCIGNLTKLRKLSDFILGKQHGSSIKELGGLQHLRGGLCIWNLQNIVNAQDALEANLKGKKHLKELELRWEGETDSSSHDRQVLNHLKPHTNLEGLFIFSYGGTRFSNWVGDSSFINITSVTISGCKYCCSLPPLGQLKSLKELTVRAFDGLMVVGPEFYESRASSGKPFQSLQTLRFEKMAQWQEWIPYGTEDEDTTFPLLQELHIIDCPVLRKALPSHLPSLTTLMISQCPQLVASIPRASTSFRMDLMDDSRDVLLEDLPYGVHSLRVDKFNVKSSLFNGMDQLGGCSATLQNVLIRNYDPLFCFPIELFQKLMSLRISKCPNLELLFAHETPHGAFNFLSSLEIKECHNLKAFPDGCLPARNLTQLSLWDCLKLKSLPKNMHSLLSSLLNLEIGNCPELESFPEEGLPSKLESLHIESCDTLIAGRVQWGLLMHPCLSCFMIGGNQDVETLPEESLLPSTLTTLKIFSFQNLKSLEYKGFQHLTSLTELTISDCPKLQCFPKEGLPSTLTSLNLWDLQNLEFLKCVHLQCLTSLRELEIWNCPKIHRLSEEGLPSTITSLTISNLQNLKSLDHGGMQNLTSLGELDILDCPKLQSIPEKGLPLSLSSLIIYNCPSLKQRCQRGEGEDWPKMSHIPHIVIDSETISETKG